MAAWFLSNLALFDREYTTIQAFSDEKEWLSNIEWTYKDGKVVILFTIQSPTGDMDLELHYPKFFPHTPPVVLPTNRKLFLGEHQYKDGTLCLEWGPDNWHHSVSVTEILWSTYRLISSIDLKRYVSRTLKQIR